MSRRVLALMVGLSMVSTLSEAGLFKLGANGAYVMGGDVEENDFGYGAQALYKFNKYFSLELSYYRFTDDRGQSDEGVSYEDEVKIDAVALSGRLEWPVHEKVSLYALGGLGYYLPEEEYSSVVSGIPGIIASLDSEVDVDNEIGFHLGAGMSFALHENLELFADHRYTFLELNAETMDTFAIKSTDGTVLVTDAGKYNHDIDFDHGMIRAGLNFVF